MAAAAEHLGDIYRTAALLARIDLMTAFATLAEERRYGRPEVDDSLELEIREGRHPVIEQLLPDEEFIPNDTVVGGAAHQLILLTGPNMGGKSTYMRQTALIVLMAHAGSWVPATEARLGPIDRIFTRIGAGDDAAGQDRQPSP